MARLLLLSDLHLSPTHGFFWDNWRIARDYADATRPDAVVVSGDLCINGPDSDHEMAFAGEALQGLTVPFYAIPGNHDVGDEPPGQDAKQLIDAPRLARWNGVFGTDRFAIDLGKWRVIGLNAQLLGSGLPEEAAQDEWLDAELAGTTRPVMLVLHKPLFLDRPDETELGPASINPEPRARLLARIVAARVPLVVSGHLHSHRDVVLDGIRYVWAPALSFTHRAHAGAAPMVAAMSFDLTGDEPDIALVDIPGLVGRDLAEIKEHGRWKFLRDMPPCPPRLDGDWAFPQRHVDLSVAP